MTKKKEEKKKTPAKPAEKNLILYEAVQENPTPEFIIVGALSKAGLLEQYENEKASYGIEDIAPSITMSKLNKIIKEFKGE